MVHQAVPTAVQRITTTTNIINTAARQEVNMEVNSILRLQAIKQATAVHQVLTRPNQAGNKQQHRDHDPGTNNLIIRGLGPIWDKGKSDKRARRTAVKKPRV